MRSIVSAISARGTVTTASWMSCSRRRSAPIAEPAWSVPMPPGCPVPQAFRRSSASAPRTSPIGMRSGRKPQRRADEIGERGRAILGAKRDEVRRRALQLARILDEHHPVAGLGDFGQQCVDERGLAGRSAAGDEDVLALADRGSEQCRLVAAHDPGRDIIVEREHSDRWATDGETRRHGYRRNEPLKPLTGFGQFGRDARRAAMDLDADVMGDKPDDAFRVRRAQFGSRCPPDLPTSDRSRAGRRD